MKELLKWIFICVLALAITTFGVVFGTVVSAKLYAPMVSGGIALLLAIMITYGLVKVWKLN